MSTYNTLHKGMDLIDFAVSKNMPTMPRHHYIIMLATAWLGLSTANYYIGLLTHSDNKVVSECCNYATTAYIIFIFLSNALFVPSNNKQKSPSDLLCGDSCQVAVIMSVIVALAPREGILAITTIITTGA